jgi:hypothetical protein
MSRTTITALIAVALVAVLFIALMPMIGGGMMSGMGRMMCPM